jgi:ABC-2 type transport system permease protein
MKQGRFITLAFFAIAVMFVSINMAAANLLSGLRIDATHDRLYTLSAGTKATVKGLDEKITLDFYAAKGALADDPALRTYAARVRDLLKAYAALSKGKIVLVEHDPAPFSKAEDAALASGIKATPGLSPDDDPLYLGLVVRSAVEDKSVIPLFTPEREASLEYEVTRAITQTLSPQRPRVAIITSLPWLFDRDPETGAIKPVAKIANDLAASFDLAVLSPDFDQLPPNTKVVVLAQPGDLSDYQRYVLDQFALRQGRLMVLLDPASSVAKDGGGGVVADSQALGNLAGAWGFNVQGDVILDKTEALPVQAIIAGRQVVAPQPLYFSIPKQGLNPGNLMTASFGRGLHVGTPGEVVFTQNPALTFEPLMTTTPDTMRMDAVRALSGLNPDAVATDWTPANARFVIGASIAGKLKTAFPDGPPTAPPARNPQMEALFGPRPALLPHLGESQREAQIVVIGDVDLLADSFFVTPEGEAADNGAFILNGMDILAGTDALVGLRSRTPSARPLVVVERMKAEAQARLLEEQQQLQTRLETATARLDELEAKGAGAGFFSGRNDATLSGAEQAEMTRFRAEVLDTRKRLRGVQEGVRASVAQVKTMLIALSAFLVPLLIALAGVWVFTARRVAARRARRAPVIEQIQAEVEAQL